MDNLLLINNNKYIQVFSPKKHQFNLLSINKYNSQIGLVLPDRLFLFSTNEDQKKQEIYCHQNASSFDELIFCAYDSSNQINAQNTDKIKEYFLRVSKNIVLSEQLIPKLFNVKYKSFLEAYFINGNISNLSFDTKQRICVELGLDALSPFVIFTKQNHNQALQSIQNLIENDFYDIYKNSQSIEKSLIYLFYKQKYVQFWNLYLSKVTKYQNGIANSNLSLIESSTQQLLQRQKNNQQFLYVYENIVKDKLNLQKNKQTQSKGSQNPLLIFDELRQKFIKQNMQLEKRQSVYGQEVFGIILDQQQYPNRKLKIQKVDNLEQHLGEIYIKPQNLNLIQTNQDEDYADYILYIFFLEKQNKITNRVNDQILSIKDDKEINFEKIIAQDPLEFEDDFGQKIKKAFALKLHNNHFYTKKMDFGQLDTVEIVIWYKSLSLEETVLFLQKKSLCFGFSSKQFFFNYKNKNYLKSKQMLINDNFWQNLRVKIISNSKIEIYLQNQFQTCIKETINLKIKAESLFSKPCYFFSQFNGLIAEVKICKRELTEDELENYNVPMNPVFKQSSKIKLDIRKATKLPERIEEIQEGDFVLNLKRSIQKTLKRKANNIQTQQKNTKISKFYNGTAESFSFKKNQQIINKNNIQFKKINYLQNYILKVQIENFNKTQIWTFLVL